MAEAPSLATAVELQIVRLGQPGASAILRGDNASFTEVDELTKQMAWSMAKTMYAEPGVGLAAPQIGANVRLIVVDPNWANDPTAPQKPVFMLNPNITWKSEENEPGPEACLSVPGLHVMVPRFLEIEVNYLDLDGEERTVACEGWDARVIQHELDHLNGVLLLDYLTPLKRDMYLRKLKKVARGIRRAFKEAKTFEHNRKLQARRMERAGCRNLFKEPVPSPEGSGTPGDGSGAGASTDLSFNEPEGS